VSEDEAKALYQQFAVPASGMPVFQAAAANMNPRSELQVNTQNPDRGPLLLIAGDDDHTVPWSMVNGSYKRQRQNPGVTEVTRVRDRGHALTIDSGWREVAETALAFVRRFAE